jgi:raffinose/stachyose/melibiose transport system permease protein
MSPRRLNLLILEILTIILFIVFMMPFLMVVLNSAKDAKEIIADPIGLPTNWGTLLLNVKTIVTSPNINYIPSFISSVIITTLSLGLIALTAAMGGWVLVRSKTKLSTFIFMMFVAAMVIPFQVVMFPLVAFFRMIREATGIPLLQTYQAHDSGVHWFWFISFDLHVPRLHQGHPSGIGRGSHHRWLYPAADFFPDRASDFETDFRHHCHSERHLGLERLSVALLILGTGGDIQTLPLAVANFVGSYVKNGI